MPDTDVLGYLNSKSLDLKRAGGWEWRTLCFFHGEEPQRGKQGRLYINVDPNAEIPGLYYCHVCDVKGALPSLKRFFGDRVSDDDDESEDRFELFKLASKFYERELWKNDEVLDYLRGPERGFTDDTIRKFHLGYAPPKIEKRLVDGKMERKSVPSLALYGYLKDLGYESKAIFATGLVQEVTRKDNSTFIMDSLSGRVTIPYLVANSVVDIRGRSFPDNPDAPKYKTCGGNQSRLFNTAAVWDAEDVVATEGEFDAMIMDQLGYRAVGFPGAKSYQDTWNGYFAPLKRVWLVFDRDEAGTRGMEKMREAIGAKARPIFLSEKGMKVDPTQWVAQGNGKVEFDKLLAEARRGNLLVSVADARKEHAEIQSLPGLRFGWEHFDATIRPGLQAAQLMIILARTGTGKTLALLNIMDRMRRCAGQEDLKFLFISLEQTRGEWWERARRIFRFYNLHASDDDAEEWWEDNIYLIDRNRMSEVELRVAVEDFIYQTGSMPDCIMLDYLGYWAQGFKGERYEAVSNAVASFKGLLKDLRVPGITPHQVSRQGKDGEEFGSDAARDSGVIEETSDFLLNMWMPDNQLGKDEAEKNGQLLTRIGKSRHGGRGMQFELQFAPLTLAMVPAGDRLCAAARKEFRWMREHHSDFDEAIYRHITNFEGHLEAVPTELLHQATLIE